MKTKGIAAALGGALMVVGSLAHGLLGFVPFRAAFEAAGIAPDVVDGSYTGWIWGSVTMAAIGSLVIIEAVRALRRRPYSSQAVLVAAVTFVAFGTWAFLRRGFNPHFLFFVVVGLLPLALGLSRR